MIYKNNRYGYVAKTTVFVLIIILESIFGAGCATLSKKARPMGVWTFDERSGITLHDKSGNDYLGTFYGSPIWIEQNITSSSIKQKNNFVLQFDGVDDGVAFNYPSPVNNFTISAWVKTTATHEIDPESTSGNDGVFNQKYLFWPNSHGGLDAGLGISIGTNGISVYEHGRNDLYAIAVYGGNIGTDWNHIAVTYTNKQPRIYLNGVLVRTGLTSPKENVFAPTHLGGGSYGYFCGIVDNVCIWNYACTQQQIQNAMNKEPRGKTTSLMKKKYIVSTVGGCKFPILFTGDSISMAKKIRKIDFFAPAFGNARPEVNPAVPVLSHHHIIQFTLPGEYYLKFNNENQFLKVLIISADEPMSQAVLRIFDFCVANMLYCSNDDILWNTERDDYILKWFESDTPAMLLCGPTMAFFRRIIEERLGLPTRNVALSAAFYRAGAEKSGTISYTAHNMPEIYLPDIGKFVLFDLNHSFVPRWLSAIEFSKKLNEKLGDTMISPEDWKSIDMDIYHNVESFLALQPISDKPVHFNRELISKNPATVNWPSLFQGLSGGVSYWGGKLEWVKPTGTEFLPGEYLYASLYKNNVLKDATIKLVESHKIKATVVTPEELAAMLEEGHKNLIESKPWLEKLPRQGRIRE